MLRLASEVFNVISDPIEARSRGVNHKNLLMVLEWKLKKMPVSETPKNPVPSSFFMEDTRSLELFQLALLIYLERVTGGSPRQSATIRVRIDRAFALFSQTKALHRQFPLLIIGCEARTDEERMAVLDLISRTDDHTGVCSLQRIKRIIQSLWAQDDLTERDLGYADKIKAVCSSNRILPSFT